MSAAGSASETMVGPRTSRSTRGVAGAARCAHAAGQGTIIRTVVNRCIDHHADRDDSRTTTRRKRFEIKNYRQAADGRTGWWPLAFRGGVRVCASIVVLGRKKIWFPTGIYVQTSHARAAR